MKVEFTENDYGIDINLYPETVIEASQLLRYSLNAKKEKPSHSLNLQNMRLHLWLKKTKRSVQKTYIQESNPC
jgi:protein associated with RNAse G/E